MKFEGKIDFARAITLNGNPHGVEYLTTAPTWTSTFTGQIIYTADTKKVFVGTDTAFVELTPNAGTHNHDDLYYSKSYINGKFDTSTGHGHDGSDSKKVKYPNLENIPSSFTPSTHDNTAHSGAGYITGADVTYSLLAGNSAVGTTATQVAQGSHNHDAIYPLKTNLALTAASDTSGAHSIGIYTVMGQSNVQSALESIANNFSNYATTATTYTQTESNSRYVTVTGDQTISGSKIISDPLSVNTGFACSIPLTVYGDTTIGPAAFIGDNTVPLVERTTLQLGKTYSGNLTTMSISSLKSTININHTETPLSVSSISTDIVLNSTANLGSADINGASISVSHVNTGALTSTSILRSKFNNTVSNTNDTVKLIETVATIDMGNVKNLYSLYVNSVKGNLFSSTIANNYGLYIEDQKVLSKITNGYAIYTNFGAVRLGDDVTVASNILPEGAGSLIGNDEKYFNSAYISTWNLNSTHQIQVGSTSVPESSGTAVQINNGTEFYDVVTENQIYNRSFIDSNYWTRSQLSTAGNSSVAWSNITGAPSFGSPTWKSGVALVTDLPQTGNVEGDIRTVANDGDGKQAQYAWNGTAWIKIADIDWGDANGVSYTDTDSLLGATNLQSAVYSAASKLDSHALNVVTDSVPPHGISLSSLGAASSSHNHDANAISLSPLISGYVYSTLQAIIVDLVGRIKTLETQMSVLNTMMYGAIDGGGA